MARGRTFIKWDLLRKPTTLWNRGNGVKDHKDFLFFQFVVATWKDCAERRSKGWGHFYWRR